MTKAGHCYVLPPKCCLPPSSFSTHPQPSGQESFLRCNSNHVASSLDTLRLNLSPLVPTENICRLSSHGMCISIFQDILRLLFPLPTPNFWDDSVGQYAKYLNLALQTTQWLQQVLCHYPDVPQFPGTSHSHDLHFSLAQ